MSDAPQQLGKYQIRRAIGKGAMGIVYEGYDPVIDRIVAIKTIKKDELDKEEAEEHSRRFLIEAKAAGRLNHKNIVGIYDYGEEAGLSFIVMEFVQGKELKSFFAARHPFSMSQIARLMGELLDALGYSHSRGVVHRDVKPDNIFVTEDGSVKLGDFGIARIDSTSKTHAGTVLGTPSYMAPEQIRGETADARSDLYAAGVILYQFLVGERPFSGGMVAVMQKVLMEMPKAPSAHNPSIPESIDNVVLRALAKAPGDRFATASEFNRDLTAAVGLSNDEDESESTMIMSPAALKALQDGPTERTGTGTGGTHTGTGTGMGTGGVGRSTAGTGARAGAVEEAKRRAEEAKRRYEEDMRRAEVELQEAEAEQRVAEVEAQAQAATWMESTQALLVESAAWRESGEAVFTQQALLVDGPASAAAGHALTGRLKDSAKGIADFVEASYALAPAMQSELTARQAALTSAATAQAPLAERIEREAVAALSGFDQKLEVLEKRLAGQDGAWSAESRALAGLDPEAGEAPIATVQARLDKLATSVDQVGKGFASVQSQPLKLPARQAERVAVIEAQLQAQGSHVARLRGEVDAARARAQAAAEARRVAEEAARQAAEAEKARKQAEDEARRKAEEEARLKAEAEAAAEKKRLAEEEVARKAAAEAEAARKAAEAAALEKQRREAAEAARLAAEAEAKRQAEERARREAEAKARAEAEAAEKKRLADEKAKAEAAARAAAEAKKLAEQQAVAEKKRLADEAAARAKAEAQRKAEEDAARKKADAEAKRLADEQAKQKAAEESRQKAEAKRQAEADAKAKEQAAKEQAARDKAAKEQAARDKADFEARRKADEAAAAARAKDGDADATMIAPIRGSQSDDAESTMIRPADVKPPVVPPKPSPVPAPSPGRNKLLLPIVGVVVVAIAAGAWFATRPSGAPAEATAASAPTVEAAASAAPIAPPPAASAAASEPAVVVAQAETASAAAPASAPAASTPVIDDAAAQRKADEDAQKKADADAARKAKADAAAQRKADAASQAQADGKPAVDADTLAKAKAQLKADADAKKAHPDTTDTTPPVKPPAKLDPKAEAADAFRKGYEAYLSGNVPEGVRQMERADAMGAQGARSRLCAIYRKPTAAEGKDFLKEANKCKGVD